MTQHDFAGRQIKTRLYSGLPVKAANRPVVRSTSDFDNYDRVRDADPDFRANHTICAPYREDWEQEQILDKMIEMGRGLR